MDICIVVLHYNDAWMTENYVNSLQRSQQWNNLTYHIVIVDNNSPDGSGSILKAKYHEAMDVTILLNDCNIGFARGNNVGISYAFHRLGARLVVVSNNDIQIDDGYFMPKLWEIYKNEPFAVLGPDIYSLKKELHQSPIRCCPMSEKQLEEYIRHIDNLLEKLKIIKALHIYGSISWIKRLSGKKPGKEGEKYQFEQTNVVVQGAFFVLSELYNASYPDGLYDGTFLYMEEDILVYRCRKKGLRVLYTPKLRVTHFDGYSTLRQKKNRCNKYIFELEETRKSCIIMLDMIRAETGE